jgi:hypothetical protein
MIGLPAHPREEQERAKVAVLRELLEAPSPGRALLARSSVLGLKAEALVRVVVGDIAPGVAREDALARFGVRFALQHVVTICDVGEGGIVALIERDPGEREVLTQLTVAMRRGCTASGSASACRSGTAPSRRIGMR